MIIIYKLTMPDQLIYLCVSVVQEITVVSEKVFHGF